VNKALLQSMKRSAYLINTSRGPLVNDADITEALHAGWIAGAALDVVSVEPLPANSFLLKAPNLTLTPHIAWAAVEARRRLTKVTAENIATFQAGKPVNVVN
jgi:glycerate dehydrogenase